MTQPVSFLHTAKNPNDRGHHPSHSDISLVEGDALKRHGLPIFHDYGEKPEQKTLPSAMTPLSRT